MAKSIDHETWIINSGDRVINKEARGGRDSLSSWEKLVYCLWVADYGMRNAGDFATARDLYADFKSEAKDLALELSLRFTHETFSLSMRMLEQEYFVRFDRICHELKNAKQAGSAKPKKQK